MGCNIHFYVEKREHDKWVSADKWTPSKYEEDKGKLVIDYGDNFFNDRCYSLFAILADVRNAETGEPDRFNPIAEPKGLPDDISQQLKDLSEEWDCNGHSRSWFTIQELLDYDWTQTVKVTGWVNAVEYFKWSQYSRGQGEVPESFCGSVGGGSVKHITIDDMYKLIEGIKKEAEIQRQDRWYAMQLASELVEQRLAHTYCQFEMEQPYYKRVRRFWSDCIPRLLQLGKPESVRIVFWFDN